MIIGRKNEQQQLSRFWRSPEAEFLAIYGRRRVGKTYLVREYFKPKGMFFEAVGQKDAPLKVQLHNFVQSLGETFTPMLPLREPTNWSEAFGMLTQLIAQFARHRKILIFLDELPWLAGRRSGMIQALDYEWNKHWSQMKNIKLVVCGSAASWMLDKLVHAQGGLYNRITGRMLLKPFSLRETRDFLRSRGLRLKPLQVLELYMILGGIPYYLRYLEKGRSISQMINDLCFQSSGALFSEFDQLFSSLFAHAEVHEMLVRAIARKREGLSRTELAAQTKMQPGGSLRKRLDELETSGFIERYIPYGKSRKHYYVKVIDEYSLFYLRWIEPMRTSRPSGSGRNYWLSCAKSPAYLSWCGYAFEAVCAKHIEQIIRAQGLDAVAAGISGWRLPGTGRKQGAQIDLLIDRTDNAITLCEIKFSSTRFRLDKGTAREMSERMDVFRQATRTDKQLFWSLITPKGICPGLWAEELISQVITLDDLLGLG